MAMAICVANIALLCSVIIGSKPVGLKPVAVGFKSPHGFFFFFIGRLRRRQTLHRSVLIGMPIPSLSPRHAPRLHAVFVVFVVSVQRY